MATIKFDFQTSGGKDLDKQFAAIAQRIDQSEGSLAKLAKVLNASESELADLAQSLGVNGVGIQKLSKYLAESTAAGVKAEDQFAAIGRVVQGLKPETFVRLQKAVAGSITDTTKAAAQVEKLADGYDQVAQSAQKATKAGAEVGSSSDASKAASQVEGLADNYEQVAKSAQKAAKAGAGVSNTTFSKEASADRRNASEIARLDRQSSEQVAAADRSSTEAIAQQDRISAEKQTAARVEADKQIATIQANSAKDVAEFISAQDAIQREKDRALDAQLAAQKNQSDRQIAQLNASAAKEIAADQRVFDREEKASDRVLQAELRQIDADSAKSVARIAASANVINADRDRASNEQIQAAQRETQRQIATEQRQSQERIAADQNASNQAIAAFNADSQRVTAQLVQNSRNASQERIAASRNESQQITAALQIEGRRETAIQVQNSRNASQERIAADRNASNEVIAAFNADSRRVTAQLIQDSRNASQERIATSRNTTQEVIAALNADSRKDTAIQVQQSRNASQEKIARERNENQQVIAAFTTDAQRVTAQLVQQSKNDSQERIASERRESLERQAALDRASRERLGTFRATIAAETSQENTRLRVESRERQALLDRRQKQDIANQKAQQAAAQRADQKRAKEEADRVKANAAAADASVVLGVSPQEAQRLSQELGLNADQLRRGLPALQKLYQDGEATGAALRVVKAKFDLTTQQLTGLLGSIKAVTDAQKQAAQATRDQKNDEARQKAIQSLVDRTGMTGVAALEFARSLNLNTEQITRSGAEFERLSKAGQLTQAEIDRVAKAYKLTDNAARQLSGAIDQHTQAELQQAKAAKIQQASATAADATGVDLSAIVQLAETAKLSADQIAKGIPALKKLAATENATAEDLAILQAKYQLNADQIDQLLPILKARVAAEKQAADDLKATANAKEQQQAQERLAAASIGLGQAIGKTTAEALALASGLGLTDAQVKSVPTVFKRLEKAGVTGEQAIRDLAIAAKLPEPAARTLYQALKAEADRLDSETVDQNRVRAADRLAELLGVSGTEALQLARQFDLTGDQAKGAAGSFSKLIEGGTLTLAELRRVRDTYKLSREATMALLRPIRDRVKGEKDVADALKAEADQRRQNRDDERKRNQQNRQEERDRRKQEADRNREEQAVAARRSAVGTAAQSTGIDVAAIDQLSSAAGLSADQISKGIPALKKLLTENQANAETLAALRERYKLEDAQLAQLLPVLRSRVQVEQQAADKLKQDAAQKDRQAADNALRVASVELAQVLGVTADQVFAFAKQSDLGAKELKTAVSKIGGFIKGTDQSEAALRSLAQGLGLNEAAAQKLYKRLKAEADKKTANNAAETEAAKQAELARRANQADQKRIAALSKFADTFGLSTDAARELVDRYALTGEQMRGLGSSLDRLAKAGKLTEDELAIVRSTYKVGDQAFDRLTQAFRQRVEQERIAAEKQAAENAETAQREAAKKALRKQYKQEQAALAKTEKADQGRALASVEVGRSLETSGEAIARFAQITNLSGAGLKSAVAAVTKSIDAGTLDQDLAGLSKGLGVSRSALQFLAKRVQARADDLAKQQAATAEAEGQAALAAAADKVEQERLAALSQFARTMGITIEEARALAESLGLTGKQMKGAGKAIDKLAQDGRLTADELDVVRQQFRLSEKALGEMSRAIGARVADEKQAADAIQQANEEEKKRTDRQKALRKAYKEQQAAAEKAQKADQSRAIASTELAGKLGVSASVLDRFAAATNLNGTQLKAAAGQISKALNAGTLDRDIGSLSKGLNLGETAIRFLAKRIQQQVADDTLGKLNRSVLPLAQALGQTTAETVDLADRLGLTVAQVKAVPAAFKRLQKAGVTGEQAIADLARTTGLTEDQSRELGTALQAQADRLAAQKNQQQIGAIGEKQKADYEAALAASTTREQQRAAESAKQAAALGLSAEQTDRFAKAADLGAKELRSAVTTISGLIKSGTATEAALAQLAPGLGLSTSAAKFLAKRLQSQADAAAQSQEQERLKKEQKRLADETEKQAKKLAKQITAIGQKQRDDYDASQAKLAAELDKQRVAAIGFGQAIGTTADRALRYAQALGLSAQQTAAVGPQLQKLLSAGDLDSALSLLTNTYKLSERSARLLIGKVEQRIAAEQAATDATKQQAAAEKAAEVETKRRQQLAGQEAAEARKRIEALQGFAAAVGQTPDQALVLANVLKLSSDQMRALPKAIGQLVQSGNDTDAALSRLGETYGLQDRQLQKLTNTIRDRINQEGQSRLAAGADNADRQRTEALPSFTAATGLTEAAARELVSRFDLTGAQMALVSGEMSRLANQGKLTEEQIRLLGQKAGLSATAQSELAQAVQARTDQERSGKEAEALRKASLQLAQALGRSGDETVTLLQSLGLTADQVRVLGPKLANLARQGDVSELALQQLQTATRAPISAIAQLATAIRANVAAQQEAARQGGLIQETQKLARALGLNADQALRFAQKLELTGQAIGQIDALKKLYAQGPVSAAALDQFRQATGLAATEFGRLAAAVRSRVALEQRQAADKQAGRDASRDSRSAAAEGRATGSIAKSLDIDVSGVQRLQAEVGKSAVGLQKAIALLNQLEDGATTADQKVELLAQSFGLTEQQARALVTTFDRCKASAKELGQNVASAAQDLGISYGAALKLQQGLGLTSQEFEQAAQRAVLLRQAGATTAEAFDALNKEFGLTRDQFDQLDAAALSSQQAMQGLATAAGAVSAALITSLKGAIGVFAEFDGEIRKAGVLSGSFDTAEGQQQFAALREEVQRLGASTQFTAKEVAETSTELVRSGFSAEQAKEALSGIVTGAIASGDSMQQLAEVTGAALNSFGLLPAASGYVNDLVVATANASPAGVKDIAESLTYVGAQAAASGQSVEDVTKLFAQLASVGVKGSTAGTGLAEVLSRLKTASAGNVTEFSNLVKGNKRMVEAFEALQLSARNADGSMKPLPEIVNQIRANVKGFSQEDQDILLKALFGVQGGNALFSLLALTDQKMAEIDEAFANSGGAAQRAAEQMTQGVSGALTAASSTIEGFQTSIGEALAPTIEYLVRTFTQFLSTVTSGFNALPGSVKGGIGALAALTAVLTTTVAAAAAFRAAATALGIAQGIAAAKTIALNTALALQSGNLVSVARSLLGFSAATTTSSASAAGFGASLKSLPATMAAAGISAKSLAIGLGAIAAQAVVLLASFEFLKGFVEFISVANGVTGKAKEINDGFDALSQKFKEIEAENPFRQLAESTDADRAVEQLIQVNRKFEDFGAGLNSFADNIAQEGIFKGLNKSFVELRAVITGNTEVLSKYGEAWGVVTYAQLEAQKAAIALANKEPVIQGTFDEAQKALVDYRKALQGANGDMSNPDLLKADAFATESIKKLKDQIEELRKAGPDGAIALKPLEAILKSLENRNPAIRPTIDTEQLAAQKEAAKESLKDEEVTVKGKLELEFDNAKAARKLQFDQGLAQEKLAFDQKADQEKLAFERQLNAEKQQIEQQIAAEKQAFEAQQQTAKNTFESQLEQRKNTFEAQSQARKDGFERQQEAKKVAFETGLEGRKQAFAAQQQANENNFRTQQENRARAFEQSQQAARKSFEQQLAAIDASKKSQFDAQRSGVERQLQLEFAASEEERARLQQQFSQEDAQNARRQQLLASVIAQEQAWEEQKRQAEVAFEEQQRAAKVAFDEQQRLAEEAFKTEQQAREVEFETQLAAEKRNFEAQLQAEKRTFEASEQETKRQFELQLQQQKQAFEAKQAAEKEAFEQRINARKQQLEDQLNAKKLAYDQEQQRKRLAFEQEQEKRKLAFENAERQKEFAHKQRLYDLEKGFKSRERDLDVKALKTGAEAVAAQTNRLISTAQDLKNTPPPKPPAPAPSPTPAKPKPRAKGGPVDRRSLYLVGEKGPELFTPTQDGYIIPNGPTRQLMGFAGGGPVRAGETIVVGEQGREAFVPANAQGVRVQIDASDLRAAIAEGIGLLKQAIAPSTAQPVSPMAPVNPPAPIAPVAPSQETDRQIADLKKQREALSASVGEALKSVYSQADQMRWSGDLAGADQLIAQATAQIQADQTRLDQQIADLESRKTTQAQEAKPKPAEGATEVKAIALNVATITKILQSAAGSQPAARRYGGPVAAGQPYLVGEAGPEIVVPSESGRVLTAGQSSRIAERAITAAQLQIAAAPAPDRPLPRSSTAPKGPGLPEVLQAIGSIQSRLATLGGHTFNFVSDQSPQEDVYATMRALRRAIA